jgi:hypothetical protein
MEAVRYSKHSVSFYRTTRRHIPEARIPHGQHCENLRASTLQKPYQITHESTDQLWKQIVECKIFWRMNIYKPLNRMHFSYCLIQETLYNGTIIVEKLGTWMWRQFPVYIFATDLEIRLRTTKLCVMIRGNLAWY